MAGNRVVNFHPRARRGGRLTVLGGARARRPEGRRAHFRKPVGFAVRPPGDGALLAPAGSVPVRRRALDREGRPALPHPPWPPSRVDRAAVQFAPVLRGRSTWLGHEGRALATGQSPAMGHGREAHTQYALPPATRVTRRPAAARWAGARLNGALIVASAKARRTLAAGQSPAMGHGRGRRPAWGASCGLKPCPLPGHGRACGKA
jgi:hypothetical protein